MGFRHEDEDEEIDQCRQGTADGDEAPGAIVQQVVGGALAQAEAAKHPGHGFDGGVQFQAEDAGEQEADV